MSTKVPSTIAITKKKSVLKTTSTTAIKGSSFGSTFITSRFTYPFSYTSDFIKSLKPDRVITVMKTGKVRLDDIGGITLPTRQRLNEIGIMSPSDAYKLYENGNFAELNAIALKDGRFGGRKVNAIESVANIIYTAPEINPDLTRDKIIADLKIPIKYKITEDFETRRSNEIKQYLKMFGIGDFKNFKNTGITIQTPGEAVTKSFVDSRLKSRKYGIINRKYIITSKNKSYNLKDNDTRNKFLNDIILDYAIRDSIFGFDINRVLKSSVIKGSKSHKGYINIRNYMGFDGKKEIEDKIKDMQKNGTLIVDPIWKFLIPNNNVMANYLLSSSSIRIGETRNPLIFKDAKKYSSKVKTNHLSIFSFDGKGKSIRLTGFYTPIESKDLDYITKFLGTNPKNGFYPIGYTHDDHSILMNTIPLEVFVKPPSTYINNIFLIDNIQETPSSFKISIDNDNYDKRIKTSLWITNYSDIKSSKDTSSKIYVGKKFIKSRNKIDKKIENITLSSLPDEGFKSMIANTYDYSGFLCNKEKFGLNKLERNKKSLQNDLEFINAMADKYYKSKSMGSAMKNAIYSLKYTLDQYKKEISIKLKKDPSKEFNKKTKPNCQLIEYDDKIKTKSIFEINKDSPVGQKINAIWNVCKTKFSVDPIEECIKNFIFLDQNLTHSIGTVGNKTRSMIDLKISNLTKLNKDEMKKVKNSIDVLNEIARGYRTHQSIKDDSGKNISNRIKISHLDKSVIGSKKPLTIAKWKFLDKIKDKIIKNI